MPEVTTELDLNISKLKAKAGEVKAEFRAMAQAAAETKLGDAAWGYHSAAAFQPGMNRGKFNVGLVSQQVQDIAVSAQMGMSPWTIMAQQGSQLAAIFGPTGMLVGGFAAVGGVALTAGAHAKKMFDEVMQGAKGAHDAFGKIVDNAGLAQIEEAFDKLTAARKSLVDDAERGRTFMGFMGNVLGVLVGGDSGAEQRGKRIIAEGELYWDQVRARQKMLELSREELDVAQARARGENDVADELKRQADLRKRIGEINALSVSDNTKEKLIADARAMSEAEKQIAENNKKNKNEAAQRELKNLGERYAEAERSVAEAGMTPAQRLVELSRQRLALEEQIQHAASDKEKLELGIRREQVEAEIVRGQMALAKEGEQTAKQREQRIESMKKQLAEAQFELVPDDAKLRNLEGKLRDAAARAKDGSDPEKQLAAQLEQSQIEKQMRELMSRAAAVKAVGLPGALSTQFDWAMGGGSSLVNDEQRRNTAELGALREEVKALRERLPHSLQSSLVFAP